MENKTLTAVEWLIEEIVLKMGIRIENAKIGKEIVEQALMLQKEQIIDAYNAGYYEGFKDANFDNEMQDYGDAEQYYTTKYGKQ